MTFQLNSIEKSVASISFCQLWHVICLPSTKSVTTTNSTRLRSLSLSLSPMIYERKSRKNTLAYLKPVIPRHNIPWVQEQLNTICSKEIVKWLVNPNPTLALSSPFPYIPTIITYCTLHTFHFEVTGFRWFASLILGTHYLHYYVFSSSMFYSLWHRIFLSSSCIEERRK